MRTKQNPELIEHCGMDLLQAITTRSSIRRYTSEPVDEALLQTILNAGFCAPSADELRPWRFIVVRERATLGTVARGGMWTGMLAGAAVGIVIAGDTRAQRKEPLMIEDCSVAAQNMLLAAHGLGLGAVWCGFTHPSPMADTCRQALGLPGHVQPVAVLSIGHPAQQAYQRPRYDAAKVHHERWGGQAP